MPTGTAVSLRGVTKQFGDVTAVAGVDLDIAEGEVFSMLGPSGSGKTTMLRMLDEPLGALDLKLREEMQVELKAIQQEVGITFIFVTHDQQEALTMSDRIAVFADGRIEQVGTPTEIYERPVTQFVAGFVGTSNVLPPDVARELVGRDAICTIRPEHLRIVAAGEQLGPDAMHTQVTVRP